MRAGFRPGSTSRFSRHDDVLTITAQIDDPICLTEPYYLTRSFALARAPLNPATHPCTVTMKASKRNASRITARDRIRSSTS
jgi:hypothetical protein